MAAVVVAPKAVAVKVAGPQAVAVAVAKGMAVDGLVERAIHPAEAAAMRRLAVAKSRFGATWPNDFVAGAPVKTALMSSLRRFATMATPHGKH